MVWLFILTTVTTPKYRGMNMQTRLGRNKTTILIIRILNKPFRINNHLRNTTTIDINAITTSIVRDVCSLFHVIMKHIL